MYIKFVPFFYITLESDGCIQEFEIAKNNGNMIIPIGSTGFAAKSILNIVKEDIGNYQHLSDYIDQLETETDIDNTLLFFLMSLCTIIIVSTEVKNGCIWIPFYVLDEISNLKSL